MEIIAVKENYNPFVEKARMMKIMVQEPSKDVLRVAKELDVVGFDLGLLDTQRYVL